MSHPCSPGCTCRRHFSDEQKRTRLAAAGRRHGVAPFRGGERGDIFAEILEPAGFVREYRIQWGPLWHHYYRLDFAHVEGKIDIELDGPWHNPARDEERTAWLQSHGWKVIRIRIRDY